jgi:hypothetical protein
VEMRFESGTQEAKVLGMYFEIASSKKNCKKKILLPFFFPDRFQEPTLRPRFTTPALYKLTTPCVSYLARFENKNIFFLLKKHSSILHRWRCTIYFHWVHLHRIPAPYEYKITLKIISRFGARASKKRSP